MWTCPKCERNFKNANQSHWCEQIDIDDLFEGKPDDLLLAFDKLLISVIDWKPCSVGATKKAIIFTKEKAWMIVRPMSKQLDITALASIKIDSPLVRKVDKYGKSYRHQIRVSHDKHISEELIHFLHHAFKS